MKKPDSQQMKSAARLYAVQALFQMEAGDVSLDEVRDQFVNHRFGEETEGGNFIRGNLNLFESLIYQAVNNQAKIDQMTDRALVAKWPIDRIDSTLRALFRAAGAELVIEKTPPKVVISEFVDIAKAFFPEGQEPGFVNAVLDHMAREIRPGAFA
jgi:N utilization substance protein B